MKRFLFYFTFSGFVGFVSILVYGFVCTLSAGDKKEKTDAELDTARCKAVKSKLILNTYRFNRDRDFNRMHNNEAVADLLIKIQNIDCSEGKVPKPVPPCDPAKGTQWR